MANTAADLKRYFGEGTRKVEAKEMVDFWKSLTEAEKEEYKEADLT